MDRIDNESTRGTDCVRGFEIICVIGNASRTLLLAHATSMDKIIIIKFHYAFIAYDKLFLLHFYNRNMTKIERLTSRPLFSHFFCCFL